MIIIKIIKKERKTTTEMKRIRKKSKVRLIKIN